jgi:hypothetical protein
MRERERAQMLEKSTVWHSISHQNFLFKDFYFIPGDLYLTYVSCAAKKKCIFVK